MIGMQVMVLAHELDFKQVTIWRIKTQNRIHNWKEGTSGEVPFFKSISAGAGKNSLAISVKRLYNIIGRNWFFSKPSNILQRRV